jgi:hypothetical protein
MAELTVQQADELAAISRLALSVEMAVLGSVSLDPSEQAALDAIATLVSSRLSALVDELDALNAAAAADSRDPPAPATEPKQPAPQTKRKGKR